MTGTETIVRLQTVPTKESSSNLVDASMTTTNAGECNLTYMAIEMDPTLVWLGSLSALFIYLFIYCDIL
jgi:hypothetical protein